MGCLKANGFLLRIIQCRVRVALMACYSWTITCFASQGIVLVMVHPCGLNVVSMGGAQCSMWRQGWTPSRRVQQESRASAGGISSRNVNQRDRPSGHARIHGHRV